MIAVVKENIPEIVHVIPQQLPIAPIPPVPPGAEALGVMTWDLPPTIIYTPNEEITANIELLNPTSEQRLYGIGYYFINPQGVIAAEDYCYFMANSYEFAAFMLPPEGEIPMVTTLTFTVPEVNYRFGLRMLLLGMVDSNAIVIQETSRLEVLLASSYNGQDTAFSGLVALMILMIPATMLVKEVKK